MAAIAAGVWPKRFLVALQLACVRRTDTGTDDWAFSDRLSSAQDLN
jgi:hypothetical protein